MVGWLVADENTERMCVCRYDSESDALAHAQTSDFIELGKQMQEEGLIGGPPRFIHCVSVAGFDSREEGLVKTEL